MKQSDNRLKKNMPIYLLRSTRKLQAHTHATMEGKLFNSTHDWEKDNTRASSVAKKFGMKWIPKGIPGEEKVRRMKALDKAQALTKVLRSKLEKNPKWIHASTLIKLQKALSTAIRKTNTGLDVCLALAGFEEVSGKKWTYMDEKECESKWDYVSEDSGSDEDPTDYETPDEKESDNESEKSEDAPSDEEESAEESDCSEEEEESEPEDEDEEDKDVDLDNESQFPEEQRPVKRQRKKPEGSNVAANGPSKPSPKKTKVGLKRSPKTPSANARKPFSYVR
jgi:hypothetical protein